MSLGRKVFAAPARLWMNWPLWSGLLVMLLLAKHAWVLFAPASHAVPGNTVTTQTAQAEQLFGTVSTAASTASLNGIRPIGIFASSKHGFAVMQTGTGQVGVGLGSEVVPGVRLVETHADYVVLERGGVRQRVDLSKAPVAAGVTPASATPPPRNEPAAVRYDPAAAAAVPAQMLEQLTPEQRKLLEQQRREMKRGRY